MKAIIPVAGAGEKLRPHTHTQPKALIPIAGKPILVHIIENLMNSNIKEFVFIIGYFGEKIKLFLTNYFNGIPDLKFHFIVQEPRLGSAQALYLARDLIQGEDEILVMLGDTILKLDYQEFINTPGNVIAVKKVDKPWLVGIVELNKKNEIKKFEEKPMMPKSNIGIAGLYKISDIDLLLKALHFNITHSVLTLNEHQLTDVLMEMLSENATFKSFFVDHWFDCGKKESVLQANAILLNRPEFKSKKNSLYKSSIIIPPVMIGNNCDIQNSIIGPNVAIGDHSKVVRSVLSNSIIGGFSELHNVILEDSIMGNDTILRGTSTSLNIGDNTEITLSN